MAQGNGSRQENLFLREIGREIAQRWTEELKGTDGTETAIESGILTQLIRALARAVIREIRQSKEEEVVALKDMLVISNQGPAAKGLAKAEEKLSKLVEHGHPDDSEGKETEGKTKESTKDQAPDQAGDQDEDEVKDSGAKYPNLKYRQPKYKNVESILKFVESSDDKGGGVKLVIMNFND